MQCAWSGVFVAEAIAALRLTWHLLLSDTDVRPIALFEVSELVSLCRPYAKEFSFGEPGILIGTEPQQDINAGNGHLHWLSNYSRLPLEQNRSSSTCFLKKHAKSFHISQLH